MDQIKTIPVMEYKQIYSEGSVHHFSVCYCPKN
jgi:hypothetical protein